MYVEHTVYPSQAQTNTNSLMYAVYGWMMLALGITAGTAATLAGSQRFFEFMQNNSAVFFVLIVVQLGLVLGLSFFLPRLSFAAAACMFIAYSVTVGVTFSTLFYVYTTASLAATFATSAATFGVMSVYGYVTKTDLTTMGSMCTMGVVGLIVASIVNIFLKSPGLDYALSFLGVVIFTLLTAYDTQKIKEMMQQHMNDQAFAAKAALIGALTLYLDFLNLFLYMLRFMGRRRSN